MESREESREPQQLDSERRHTPSDTENLLAGEVHWPLEGPPRIRNRPSIPIAVSETERIEKTLIQIGEGEPPTCDCKCFVHFQAWTASGEEVENTREGREAAQVIVSRGKRCQAARSLARADRLCRAAPPPWPGPRAADYAPRRARAGLLQRR